MIIKEKFYRIKKKIKKTYKAYFTVNGTYTSVLPDKYYLKRIYKKRLGKKLDLRHPKTFTEKLNWLKLYDRRPEYTVMVDKYAVREYVKEKIGEEYLVPLIGVWDRVEDIDFDSLPGQFVLKCNHDNGVIICLDKSTFDIEKAKRDLNYHLNRNYYKKLREWPYKNVPRKIICEKYMESSINNEITDYRFFCFNGKVKMILMRILSPEGIKEAMYNEKWKYLNIQDAEVPMEKRPIEHPAFFEQMLDIAEKLGASQTFVRVDYNVWNNKIYFGELTFFPLSGAMEEFSPDEWNYTLGSWLKLPDKKIR